MWLDTSNPMLFGNLDLGIQNFVSTMSSGTQSEPYLVQRICPSIPSSRLLNVDSRLDSGCFQRGTSAAVLNFASLGKHPSRASTAHKECWKDRASLCCEGLALSPEPLASARSKKRRTETILCDIIGRQMEKGLLDGLLHLSYKCTDSISDYSVVVGELVS